MTGSGDRPAYRPQRVVLGVSGSVSATLAPTLATAFRLLWEAEVRVVVTRAALTFVTVPDGAPDPAPALIAERLTALVGGRRKVLYIETVDGVPARASRLGPVLLEHGFVDTAQGLLRRPGA